MQKPNIVFVMADQMSAKALSCYGHPVVQTPVLSRLAREGVVFENAYCNSPLCGPSRASMMTGRLPSKVGGYDNAAELSAAIPTFAHYLRAAGYRTCLSGKMHFVGPDQLHGYGERLTTDVYPSDFGWTPNWSDPDAKVRFQDMTNVLATGPCLRSMQMDYDDDTAIQAQRWLYDRARDDQKQPFMLTVSFTSPHDPYVARPEFWDLYDDAEIDLPKVPPIPADKRDAHSARLHDHYSIGEVEVTEADLRRLRHGYYAAISYVDSLLAGIVQVLEETGLDRDTVLIFASDHGDMMGERGMYYKKCFFEWSARVPLVVWAPGQVAPGRVADPVSLVDVLPTFADLAGAEVLDTDGTSLVPALQGRALPNRSIAAEYLSEGVTSPAFMLLRDGVKLLWNDVDPPVLFDLGVDPDEREDQAASDAYADRLDALQTEARALWDVGDLTQRIIADQNRRRLINQAHQIGSPPTWDFQPFEDAAQQYVRAGRWTTEVEAQAHLDVPAPVAKQ